VWAGFTTDTNGERLPDAGASLYALANRTSRISINEGQDRRTTDFNPPLCQQLFNITMAEIESEIEPHRVRDDIGRESMAFICRSASIHSHILAQRQLIWQYWPMASSSIPTIGNDLKSSCLTAIGSRNVGCELDS
jgi:hypothetical protein